MQKSDESILEYYDIYGLNEPMMSSATTCLFIQRSFICFRIICFDLVLSTDKEFETFKRFVTSAKMCSVVV